MELDGVRIDSLHLSTGSIAQILRDYHASGAIQHNRVVAVNNRIFEFTVGAVRDLSIDNTVRRGSGRRGATALPLRAVVPLAFNYRPEEVLADPGTNGFALVHVAMLFELPVHRGVVPVHLNDHVRIDCTPTDANDITLFGMTGAEGAEIVGSLVQFVHRYVGGTYPLPAAMGPLVATDEPIELMTYVEPVQQVVVRAVSPKPEMLERPTSPDVVAFGGGSASWVGFLSAASLDREMVKLAHGVRGILESFGSATAQKIEVTLEDGLLRVLSSPRDATPASGMRIGISMSGAGTLGCVARHLDPAGYYASEELEHKICGLVSALLSPIGDTRPAPRVAAQPESARARLLYPEIRRNGILFHGAMDRLEALGPPVATFSYLRAPSSPTQFVFNALSSWSPGCEITEVSWNFGDGVTTSSVATGLTYVITHNFKTTGSFNVSLRVTDSLGRVARHHERVSVGRVVLEIALPVAVGPNQYRTALVFKSGNAPLPDLKLQLSTRSETRKLSAGRSGRFLFAGRQVLFARTSSREWSDELTEPGTVTVETPYGRSDFPVGLMDGESYGRLVQVIQFCDQALSQQLHSPRATASKVQLWALLSDIKSSLREGTLAGAASLVELKPSADDPAFEGSSSRRLEALHVLLEQLLKQ